MSRSLLIKKILNNLPKQHNIIHSQYSGVRADLRLSIYDDHVILQEFYPNENLAYSFRYNLEGKPHGYQTCYDLDKNLINAETWFEGRKHGYQYKK